MQNAYAGRIRNDRSIPSMGEIHPNMGKFFSDASEKAEESSSEHDGKIIVPSSKYFSACKGCLGEMGEKLDYQKFDAPPLPREPSSSREVVTSLFESSSDRDDTNIGKSLSGRNSGLDAEDDLLEDKIEGPRLPMVALRSSNIHEMHMAPAPPPPNLRGALFTAGP